LQLSKRENQHEKDTCDGTTTNTTRNLANLTNQEQWMGLCELASNEQDQDKLGRSLKEFFAFWKTNRRGLTPLLMACHTTHHC
jgi:hypothetical protein